MKAFAKKNLLSRAEKTFLRINTIWYAFYSKFATFIDLEKNSSFSKNPNFERFENCHYSNRILRQIY